MNWLRRNKGVITFAVSLLVLLLLVANAWKLHLVSVQLLAAKKDAISAVTSVASAVVLIAGAIFSYYRFFRGRTLSLRLELSLCVSVHDTPNGVLLHSIDLRAKNVGTSTVWNPVPKIIVKIHGPAGIDQTIAIAHWWEEDKSDRPDAAAVIEPSETVSFFALREIPKGAWAVTYHASLRADSGDTWYASSTISNRDPQVK